MKLYNIGDLTRVTVEREYILPSIWAGAELRFGRNATPTPGVKLSTETLFYLDPSARVLNLTAKGGANPNALYWLFVEESYFRSTSHVDQRCIPWGYWGQVCLIKELAASAIIGVPQVVGSRIVYLESESGSRRDRARMSVIDFATPPNHPGPGTRPWLSVGPHATLVPNELSRSIPSSTTGYSRVKGISASEDNIIVFFVSFSLFTLLIAG